MNLNRNNTYTKNRLEKPSNKLRLWIVAGAVLAFSLGLAVIVKPPAAQAGAATVGPDVTVFELNGINNYGSSGGVQAYSVGTTSCNIGDQPLWWCSDFSFSAECIGNENRHPVIAQNLYRLKDGRFEQLGMSWLKHGFLSVNSSSSGCGDGTCESPPEGFSQLGVGCTDPYDASLNGDRPLGLRSEVNATTGLFPTPSEVSFPASIDQRLQVAQKDVDPAQNTGARYWVEGHYIASDDAAAGRDHNNASYREVDINPANFGLSFNGPTVREKAAIFAWQQVDPEVELVNVDVAQERFHAARRVTDMGGGVYHYEFAIHNMNSDRSARSFTIQFPGNTTITEAGFRDVDHHSGEMWDTTDWTTTIDGPSGSVSWSTSSFDVDPQANALRWGTLYSFWFDADRPPHQAVHTLGLFKPGSPEDIEFQFSLIFEDDFEAGNTSAWTNVLP